MDKHPKTPFLLALGNLDDAISRAERALGEVRACATELMYYHKWSAVDDPEQGLLTVQEAKDLAIARALRFTGGNKLRAARICGINAKTIYTYMHRNRAKLGTEEDFSKK